MNKKLENANLYFSSSFFIVVVVNEMIHCYKFEINKKKCSKNLTEFNKYT